MRKDTKTPRVGLRGWDGYVPCDLNVIAVAANRELLTGFYKDAGPQHRPDRPFRIVIHSGFNHPELGFYYWQELNLQVRYALRHGQGEINITVPLLSAAFAG
jgi:hypothetical protein